MWTLLIVVMTFVGGQTHKSVLSETNFKTQAECVKAKKAFDSDANNMYRHRATATCVKK